MTSDRLAGAVLILRPMSIDDDAVLDAIREEMKAADAYRDAECVSVTWKVKHPTHRFVPCNGENHHIACPVFVAHNAWMTAMDARRKL